MTDDPRLGPQSPLDPDWGFRPFEAHRLFGVYHRTPVQPWIAAPFIADTGAAT
jgi:hypothetical protein